MRDKILVIGCGYMAQNAYIPNLLKLGIEESDIIVIDLSPKKIEIIEKKYPKMMVGTTYLEFPFDYPEWIIKHIRCAFVLTNTSSHDKVIVDLLRLGVQNIFVEKPLALDSSGVNYISQNMEKDAHIFTAFLINFSGAIKKVVDFMGENNLYLAEAFSIWGKDRTGDNRPSPGDLQDELVHSLNLIYNLAKINQGISSHQINLDTSHLRFVDSDAQKRAFEMDNSFPLLPNSSSALIGKIITDGGTHILVNIYSSFVMIKQTRKVLLTLSGIASMAPEYLMEIDFDVNRKDILSIKKIGKNQPVNEECYENDKILDEISAFLEMVNDKGMDPRLTDFATASEMVRLIETAA